MGSESEILRAIVEGNGGRPVAETVIVNLRNPDGSVVPTDWRAAIVTMLGSINGELNQLRAVIEKALADAE